jgi:hypothetical protein
MVPQSTLTYAASPAHDLFGAAVALSSDGTIALVSSARGSYVFTRAVLQTSSYGSSTTRLRRSGT